MRIYKGTSNSLRVSTGNNALLFDVITSDPVTAYPPPWSILMRDATLRELRDQINEHLGDKAEPSPVGTIVVGEGLTEAQKSHVDEKPQWEALVAALHGFSWNRTQECGLFWRTLLDRAHNIIACMEQEKKSQLSPILDHVQGISLETTRTSSAFVMVKQDGAPSRRALRPEEARELAAALVKHADAAEKR